DALAIAMTGELADCFATKAAGVRAIVAAVVGAASGRLVRVYGVDGRWREPKAACDHPGMVAASNWHALAVFATRYVKTFPGLLIDVGSTTTDIVRLDVGGPTPRGFDDTARLLSGELIYSGVERTPLCAVVSSLPWRGALCPVAAEVFATTLDVYLMLGELPELEQNCDAADGRGRTREFAQARIARMICSDSDRFTADDAVVAASAVRQAQVATLADAARRVASAAAGRTKTVVLTGHGEFLARAVVPHLIAGGDSVTLVSLCDLLGPQASRSAPAHALAVLAAEQDAACTVGESLGHLHHSPPAQATTAIQQDVQAARRPMFR
ncbi:MAG TPA: hydantoinase/oxoprolinase family protein, partial [Lacipirellulaceae bacterium]|nr:hydantoinase/oxoprolinase family protein [Lacipirellulaceae bacterium]